MGTYRQPDTAVGQCGFGLIFLLPVYIAIGIIVIFQLVRLVIGVLQASDDQDRKHYKDGLKTTFAWVIGAIVVFELGVAVLSWIFGINIVW